MVWAWALLFNRVQVLFYELKPAHYSTHLLWKERENDYDSNNHYNEIIKIMKKKKTKNCQIYVKEIYFLLNFFNFILKILNANIF